MSKELSRKSYIFDSDIGSLVVVTRQLVEFDVEDIIRNRSIAQARLLQMINVGKTIDINRPKQPRTIDSVFIGNDVEVGA